MNEYSHYCATCRFHGLLTRTRRQARANAKEHRRIYGDHHTPRVYRARWTRV